MEIEVKLIAWDDYEYDKLLNLDYDLVKDLISHNPKKSSEVFPSMVKILDDPELDNLLEKLADYYNSIDGVSWKTIRPGYELIDTYDEFMGFMRYQMLFSFRKL